MKKVLLVTFNNSKNYGAVLQAMSLYDFFDENDCDVQFLNYVSNAHKNKYKLIDKPTSLKGTIVSLNQLVNINKTKEKYKKFDSFIKNNSNTTKHEYKTIEDFYRYPLDFDLCVTGSDQVFNVQRKGLDKKVYMLDIPLNVKRKASYAGSFGKKDLSENEIDMFCNVFKDYYSIGIREDSSSLYFKKSELSSKVVDNLDPVFLHDSSYWIEYALRSNYKLPKNGYVVFYDLLGLKQDFKKAREFAASQKKKLLIITDSFVPRFYSNSIVIRNAGPYDFLKILFNADVILTNSYHGVCFSIIFKKAFQYYCPDIQTGDRIYNLFNKLHIKNDSTLNREYLSSFCSLSFLAEDSKKYLIGLIDKNNKSPKSLTKTCFGCGCCVDTCPKKAISIQRNVYGKAKLIIGDACVRCGLCVSVCPSTCDLHVFSSFSNVCAYKSNNKETLINSASGGFVRDFLMFLLSNKYKVMIPTLDLKNKTFDYSIITDPSKIESSSKYFRASTEQSFAKIINELKKYNENICVVGTPCYIASLDCLLSKLGLRSKVLLIDFECHGTPSFDYFLDYIKEKESKLGRLLKINFRYKSNGTNLNLLLQTEKGKFVQGWDSDPYYYGFQNNITLNLECYTCNHLFESHSDIRVADFWTVNHYKEFFSELNNYNVGDGLSLVRYKDLEIINRFFCNNKHIDISSKYVYKYRKTLSFANRISFSELNYKKFSKKISKYIPFKSKVKKCIKRLIRHEKSIIN